MLKDIQQQHSVTAITTQYTGKGVSIAVMEGGFNLKHPGIKHALSDPREWYDGWYDCNGKTALDLNRTENFYTLNGEHGNHVLGLIAGIDHNNQTKLGLAPEANLIPVLGINSACIEADSQKFKSYIRALSYLTTIDVRIINLSQVLNACTEVQEILIKLVKQGKIIVYAAGNDSALLDNSKLLQNPLLLDGLLVVGSLNEHDSRATGYKSCIGSNYVTEQFRGNFIWARGEERFSLSAQDYKTLSGTSMAAPTITGALALLLQQNPDLTNREAIKIITQSGTKSSHNHPKLNLENMLLPATQKAILNQSSVTNVAFTNPINQEFFPAIQLELNDFPVNQAYKLPTTYEFRKLTSDEVKKYQTDLDPLMKNNHNLLIDAKSSCFYGIFRTIENVLVQPFLCYIDANHAIIFIAGTSYFIIDQIAIFMNELGFQLGQLLKDNGAIFANWGEFEIRDNFKDLSRPNIEYFHYIHATPKQDDLLPDVHLTEKDLGPTIEVKNFSFKKWSLEDIHRNLLSNRDQNFFQAYTSSFTTIYLVNSNGELATFSAHLNEEEKTIVLVCKHNLFSSWFEITHALIDFYQQAKALGYESFVCITRRGFNLPLQKVIKESTPILPTNLNQEDFNIYSPAEFDLTAIVGNNSNPKIPGLLYAISQSNQPAIDYYLKHHPNPNTITDTTRKENALHYAARWSDDLNLVSRLMAAGVDANQLNFNKELPAKIAKARFKKSMVAIFENTALASPANKC